MIKLPFKIIQRKRYDAKESYIKHLEGLVNNLEFELSKYDRLRDEKGRFISDRDGLIRMLHRED